MRFHFSRRSAVGAVAATLALGGAGAAVAASQSSSASPRQTYLDDVAKHLGVSPQALGDAVRAADVERIEAALASGRITRERAQKLERRLSRGAVPFFGARPGLARGRRAFLPGRGRGLGEVAAGYLGITLAELRDRRLQGNSLAQIAEATPGKSVQGLTDALVAAVRARVDAAVAAGHTTADREQRFLAHVVTRIEALIHRKAMPGAARAGR